ncbi:MAG: hypothetical protein AAB527_03870 [Patescibacteria group bacterium]
MATPEKFSLPPQESKKAPDADAEKIEFQVWQERIGRTIEGNRLLNPKDHDKFLDSVDPYSLKKEDMEWDKKIRSGEFSLEEFEKFQREMIPRGKKDPRTNFMRHLTNLAKKALDEKELKIKLGIKK